MSDHNIERFLWLDEEKTRRVDFGSSHGVCDFAYNQFDDVGNLKVFVYEQMDPEKVAQWLANMAETVFAAKSFHAEVVAQLRAESNGATPHEADGEA